MSDQVVDNPIIRDTTYTHTVFIIQYRQRNIEDIEDYWHDVEDIPIVYSNMHIGPEPPYANEFHTLERALEAIELSKHFRSFQSWIRDGHQKETPMEAVERMWEYRVIEKIVTTSTKITLIRRNI